MEGLKVAVSSDTSVGGFGADTSTTKSSVSPVKSAAQLKHNVRGDFQASDSTLKDETASKKAFALQDKVILNSF